MLREKASLDVYKLEIEVSRGCEDVEMAWIGAFCAEKDDAACG
jgi:hypothetical protein